MKRNLLLIPFLSLSIYTYAHSIVFVSSDSSPLPEVQCTGLTQDMDSVGSWVSDSNGVVTVDSKDVVIIQASRPGYTDRLIRLPTLGTDTVTLRPATLLSEVVVTPDDVQEFGTHTSYRLSPRDMERYPNVLQSLNLIPDMTVLQNGMAFFEGKEDIRILVDGVETTRAEIQTLSKEDIARVDVYATPPVRFMAQGVGAVIDIRLRSRIHGGNGALDLSQAFAPLKGTNSAALYYNYRQSRFSVVYTNENSHYRKYRQSERLRYSFDGREYDKTKQGMDSKSDYDDNTVGLTYQINIPGSFLYNVKAGVAANSDRDNLHQRVTANDTAFLARNYLRSGYTRYNAGNYIEKQFANGSSLTGNVNYFHYSTDYDSRYMELTETPDALRDSHSQYHTSLNSIFSEVQYQLPPSPAGYISVAAYEVYKHSGYHDSATSFYQYTNNAGLYGMWTGRFKSLGWYVNMGLKWMRTASRVMDRTRNLVMPSPQVNVYWTLGAGTRLSADYSYTGSIPSIAQLSETNQWLDTRLVYHGNATLRPYRTHTAGIRLICNTRYSSLSVRGSYESSPGRICDMYTATDAYMLQTLVNLDRYRTWGGQMDLTLKPLGNTRLAFWNRLVLYGVKGSNREYSWRGSRFQWMSDLSLNLTHWTLDLFYQYPGRLVEGQLERPRAQCWSASAMYRPNTSLSVGLEWFMPFGKGFKESEHTVNSAPVSADTETVVRDRANMLSVTLSYNFSFGRNRNTAAPRYDNRDNDAGILHK